MYALRFGEEPPQRRSVEQLRGIEGARVRETYKRIAARKPHNPEQQVRIACRDVFRESRLLEKIIPGIEDMLAAGEIDPPERFEEQVGPAIPNPESIGDAGHRA